MSGERSVFWQPWQGQGMEHLRLTFLEDHIVARGDVMAIAGSSPFRLRYKIKCDSAWHTRKLELEVHDRHGSRERHIKADGQGNWHDDEHGALTELAGCLDVDISATPFTNTLALRRLDLQPGENASPPSPMSSCPSSPSAPSPSATAATGARPPAPSSPMKASSAASRPTCRWMPTGW